MTYVYFTALVAASEECYTPISRLGGKPEAQLQFDTAGVGPIFTPIAGRYTWIDPGWCTPHCRDHIDHRPRAQHQQLVRAECSDHHVWIAIEVHVHPS